MTERKRSPEEIRRELERLRQALPPEQYAKASARLVDELKRAGKPRRYAIT